MLDKRGGGPHAFRRKVQTPEALGVLLQGVVAEVDGAGFAAMDIGQLHVEAVRGKR